MFKLAYSKGALEALIKLGATQLMQKLTPAQKAYMKQLTRFGAPTKQLPPSLAHAQQQWRQFSQKEIPELIGASENYLISEKGKAVLNPEGMRRSTQQSHILDKWLRSKGPQIVNPEVAMTGTAPTATGTAAATHAEPLASSGQAVRRAANVGTADTAYNIAARKPRPGMQFAKTLLRRFAHI